MSKELEEFMKLGAANYFCHHCGKKFKDFDELLKHYPIHEDEKPMLEWLIDDLVPNKGKSVLIDFNKKRLLKAINKRILSIVDEIIYEQQTYSDDFRSEQAVAIKDIDYIRNKLISDMVKKGIK